MHCLWEWNIQKEINCFRCSQNQMIYSQVKLCKVNFAWGFLFEVVITKQVRSQVRKSVGKESLKEAKKRKEILKKEKRRRRWRRASSWGHKIKRSYMYVFNLSYGSKEWFSVLKWWKEIFIFEDIKYRGICLQKFYEKRHTVDKMED